MNKRKFGETGDEVSNEDRWNVFRDHAGQQLKDRQNQPKKKPALKGHYVNYITTRRVRFDEGKKKYIPLEDKQSVEMMSNLDFDIAHGNIWKYYEKEQGFSRANYDMQIITGVFGLRVQNTLQLEGKKDLFILFEQKIERAQNQSLNCPSSSSSEVGHFEKSSNQSSSFFHQRTKTVPVPVHSIFPRITPSVILNAAKIVDTERKVETAVVQKLIMDSAEWVWCNGFEIKCVIGQTICSGTFRIAKKILLLEYGNLIETNYVIKVWNEASIEGRKSECPDKSEMEILTHLSKWSVQCQAVARGLCDEVKSLVDNSKFGDVLEYIPSYLIRFPQFTATLEPELNGQFVKYMNNSMEKVLTTDQFGLKASALAHFSLNYMSGDAMLTDLQGCGRLFTDPELATTDRYDARDKQLNFGFGNFGGSAIDTFKQSHKCNYYCEQLKLVPYD